MTAEHPPGFATGRGDAPETSWVFTMDAPLVSLSLGRECGQLIAADVTGGRYVLGPNGRITAVNRGPVFQEIVCCDTGNGGAALLGDQRFAWLSERLDTRLILPLPELATGLAIEAHGRYAAIALTDSTVLVVDDAGQQVCRYETPQPLIRLKFVDGQPAIVGIGKHGLLCCHQFRGHLFWSTVQAGDFADIAVDGEMSLILVASFGLGVQQFDETGHNVGSFQFEGTAARVAQSQRPFRIAVATVERHLYWLDTEGALIWGAGFEDDVRGLCVDPLGNGLVCGLASGRILRLDWAC